MNENYRRKKNLRVWENYFQVKILCHVSDPVKFITIYYCIKNS